MTITPMPLPAPEAPVDAAEPYGLRVVCNRDELRARPPAQPPVLRRYGQRRAILPVDPVSAGTWIAANDAGLIFVLLNYHPHPAEPWPLEHTQRRSRGTVIPALLACATFAAASSQALRSNPRAYPPYRLLIVSARSCCAVQADGRTLQAHHYATRPHPLLFTSSGLGDALVEGPRRELFASFLAHGPFTPQQQDAFHAQRWAERPELSVWMSRADACTVSRTAVELTAERMTLIYRALTPPNAAAPAGKRLELRIRS